MVDLCYRSCKIQKTNWLKLFKSLRKRCERRMNERQSVVFVDSQYCTQLKKLHLLYHRNTHTRATLFVIGFLFFSGFVGILVDCRSKGPPLMGATERESLEVKSHTHTYTHPKFVFSINTNWIDTYISGKVQTHVHCWNLWRLHDQFDSNRALTILW